MKNNVDVSLIYYANNINASFDSTIKSLINQSVNSSEIIIIGNKKDIARKIFDFNLSIPTMKIIDISHSVYLFNTILSTIKTCKGKYVSLIDEKHSYSVDYFRLMIENEKNRDFDMAISNTFITNKGKYYYYNLDPILNSDIILKNEEAFEYFLDNAIYFDDFYSLSNKVIKKELLIKGLESLKEVSVSNKFGGFILSFYLWYYSKSTINVNNAFCYKSDFHLHNEDHSFYSKHFEILKNKLTDFCVHKRISKSQKEKIEVILLYFNECVVMKNKITNINDINYFLNFKNIISKSLNLKLNFYYSNKTEIDFKYYLYENIKKAILDKKHKIISFDIFDTLIIRPFLEPSDLFRLLDSNFNKIAGNSSYIYFSQMRSKSESNCREKIFKKNGNEEVTLDEIYEQIYLDYHLPIDILSTLKNKELELEIKFCKTRTFGKELYELAIYSKKDVILTSDIYLDMKTIKRILNKNNYEKISHIFISSETKVTKNTSRMYDYVINKLKVNFQDIVHIGDNYETDYLIANKKGITSFHLQKISENFYNNKLYKHLFLKDHLTNIDLYDSLNFIGNRCFLAEISNELYDSTIFSTFNDKSFYNSNPVVIGKLALASSLFSYAFTICKEAKKNNIKKIHFVSRDGYMIKEAYDIIAKYVKDAPESNYLYCSRKLLFPISIKSKFDFYSLFYSNQTLKLTVIDFYDIFESIFSIDKKDYLILCKNNSFYGNELISDQNKDLFIAFINENLYDENVTKLYRKKVRKHYEKIIGENNLIVDIGYSGRAESIFTELLGYPVNSYCIHTTGSIAYERLRKSNYNLNTFFKSRPKLTGSIRERLFMKSDKSCIKLKINKDDNINLIFDNTVYSNLEISIINLIQKSSLKIIENYMEDFALVIEDMIFKNNDMCVFLENYLHNPKKFDSIMFKSFKFEDSVGVGKVTYNLYDEWIRQLSLIRNKNKKDVDKKGRKLIMDIKDTKMKKVIKKIMKKIYLKIYKEKK
ncbi:MAG: HAD-IA family hydrolase [Romboutsia sp.]